ncbi:UDP-glucose--hexose-1-phosphate uridylyltransferase [Staphylococcus massiliensis]|uniref:Galactose-1-phosphate uridylyltransferase n=1 Tax=Staphylococcus massiliensis S46 TaxID=1229783 RepID=K9ASE2_9STAP|nr:UDP-glucose--hexose-1-phosphate uridylyltransferase [Staphylococcus massiliensis]EKU48956.1 galactose-1-phosphate uridylyltransferase [Staphylococcus massiliensis S46]MCG3399396.1 UDP-glucose--hexose-1-phosphate uridylyltransferase [Staphylococcus massiliensis]MCG3411532.1 UDP-glucose--hexose-1-phosphate uridylyltransferase [Staphylococcus massiliensis]PNZ98762.1 UDP-glucose--hexose-1-phosphate uridylyltransferase [Staphylococcus massiliensis CCUG 55927]
MTEPTHIVQLFRNRVIEQGAYAAEDAYYLDNRILHILKADDFDSISISFKSHDKTIHLVQAMIQNMIERDQLDDSHSDRAQIEAALMDLLTPAPSQVNQEFYKRYQESPEAATSYFYQLCHENHYIQEETIQRNIEYTVDSEYGELEITINLSKPEKDAKQIASMKHEPETNYPKCALCFENEGYYGTNLKAARSNHRIIRLNLNGDTWGFQYSPYAYFREHSIVLSETHRPMEINKRTFQNLMSFIEQFPHYTIGSNADIPIVGGSILTHNHYQAGHHTFPMAKAKTRYETSFDKYPGVKLSVVDWPMSVIRLSAKDKEILIEACDNVRDKWNHYSDESVEIKAFSDSGERHHTVTPIARFNGDLYEMDLVLRDNQTSEAYPDGMYHPHPDVQHIKKENIGLIEVMGTAILPGRLKDELQAVKAFLLDQADDVLDIHRAWATWMKTHYTISEDNVDQIIKDEVGRKFKRVLQDCGVFKRDTKGEKAFEAFIQHVLHQ